MPITALPQFDPASVYQPVVYKTQFGLAAPESVAYIEVTIRYNGVTIAVDNKRPSSIVGTTYFFEVDISAYLQRALAPNQDKSSMFGDLSGLNYSQNNDAFGDIEVQFKYAIQNEFGIIGDPTFTETSLVQKASIAIRQNGDERDLDAYTTTLLPFLTNRTESITSPGCASFLSFYNYEPAINGMRLIALDSSGAVINTHYTFGTFTSIKQNTAAVGYENIDASLATDWLNGDDKPILSAAASYLIDFGDITADISGIVSAYTPYTQQALYEIDQICSKKLKLFWLNELGGVDDYALPFVALSAVVSSERFEKPLAWDAGAASPHAQYDHGRLRNNLSANRVYRVETRVASNTAEYLRALITSAEIYIVNPDDEAELWRVFPSDLTYVERVGFGLVNIGFDLNLSQDYVLHRV